MAELSIAIADDNRQTLNLLGEILGGYRYLLGDEVEFDADGKPLLATAHMFNFSALTFGQISKMFEFLPQNIQGTVCQDFGNVKKNEMIKYLKVLTL